MKITSAYANKMLRQLNEEKEYWLEKEGDSCFYTAAVDETPAVPEYDYLAVCATIGQIDEKICRINHAANLSNGNSVLTVNGKEMTVDMILVFMAQLNRRKEFLDRLRKHLPQERVQSCYGRTANRSPEYEYVNYDRGQAKADFDRVSKEILDMQMALDIHNQTAVFEVEI